MKMATEPGCVSPLSSDGFASPPYPYPFRRPPHPTLPVFFRMGSLELFRHCIAEVSFTMCGHPRLQCAILINTVVCGTGGLVVIAQEQCYEIDGFRSGLAVVLFMSVREASSLRF